MIQEKHEVKLTNNQRKVLDYIIAKAEGEHSLSVDCPATEIQSVFKFGSRQTAYSIITALKDKGLITTLADEITLNPELFAFKKESIDSTNMSLRFILEELNTEKEVFPFLDKDKRKDYFLYVASNKELAMKINKELTEDICEKVKNNIFEFPLKPLKAKVEIEVEHCFKVLSYHDFHSSNDTVYEAREIEQCINYLQSVSLEEIYKYSPFNRENTEYLLDEWVRDEVDDDE